MQYTVDRETIDVPSFISYTSQSISALSWVHTSAIRFWLSGYVISPTWAQIPNMHYCIV